ncbi:MAG: FHA domain-containing protein [Thermoguttaceae bacterium]
MTLITLRILDGPERGKSYHQITTPVSIGREEGNLVQLSDERISRYHLKIHEDNGDVLLTDLQSTNGTRINGESIHVWSLRPGDVISIGRSFLLFGSGDEIAARLKQIEKIDLSDAISMDASGNALELLRQSFGELMSSISTPNPNWDCLHGKSKGDLMSLYLLPPPSLPKDLSPQQMARITEILHYFQLRFRLLGASVKVSDQHHTPKDANAPQQDRVSLSALEWQNFLDLYDKISTLLLSVNDT